MNTGIGDAVNLAWKLAAVVQGRAGATLLDSYEPERIAYARRLVNSTNRMFRLVATRSLIGGFWRASVVPRIISVISRFPRAIRLAFRTLSQIDIAYRQSPISAGSAGGLRGGDRLPWVGDQDGDNFAPLSTLDWQVHVYGSPRGPLLALVRSRGLQLAEFPWTDAAGAAGLVRDAAYLVRPDGHIALADPEQNAEAMEGYLAQMAIVPRTEPVLPRGSGA